MQACGFDGSAGGCQVAPEIKAAMAAGGLARVFLSTGPDTTGDDVADLQSALSLPAGSMAMLARRSARRLLRGRAAGRGAGPVREGWARIPEGQRRHDSRA